MAYNLDTDKKIAIISLLCENMSIRGIERATGVHRDTIMRLGVRIGEGCKEIQDKLFHNLPGTRYEVDEIWGFIRMKQKTANLLEKPQFGDIWSWIALHFAYYNLCKTHGTIRCTPAMAAGVTETHWTVGNLVEMIEG